MASREEKAIRRLKEARGPLPYADVSRALRGLGWVEVKGRGSHKVWMDPEGQALKFAVRHPGGEVLAFYVHRMRIRVGLEVTDDG